MKGSVKEYLAGKIPSEHLSLIYRSYDLIGDIAVIRVPEEASRYKRLIAEAIMHVHKHVKSVWAQARRDLKLSIRSMVAYLKLT